MFLTWSLADAWSWLVHLPFLGGAVLASPIIGIMLLNWNDRY